MAKTNKHESLLHVMLTMIMSTMSITKRVYMIFCETHALISKILIKYWSKSLPLAIHMFDEYNSYFNIK